MCGMLRGRRNKGVTRDAYADLRRRQKRDEDVVKRRKARDRRRDARNRNQTELIYVDECSKIFESFLSKTAQLHCAPLPIVCCHADKPVRSIKTVEKNLVECQMHTNARARDIRSHFVLLTTSAAFASECLSLSESHLLHSISLANTITVQQSTNCVTYEHSLLYQCIHT